MSQKKDDLPAMPFYVGDWLKAPDIRALSPSAKGIWIDMLCFMWESKERGVLKFGNKIVDRDMLARMLGFARVLLDPLLDELLELGIYSIREDGAIFSRRMIKDQKIREIRSISGQKGGFASQFAKAKHQAKSEQIIENENENEIIILNDKTLNDININDHNKEKGSQIQYKIKEFKYDFNIIYDKYPKKLGKKSAERHFKASVKTDQAWTDINQALNNFLNSKIAKGDPQYIPHASTWFNNWQDWVAYQEKGENEDVPSSIRHLFRDK